MCVGSPSALTHSCAASVLGQRIMDVRMYVMCKQSCQRRYLTMCRVGQNHIYTVHKYGNIGREIVKCTVINGAYIRYLWQGNHQIYGYKRCIYTVILAGKSSNIRSYTVHIYGNFGREIVKYTVIYGANIR
jgi:hypothetical protein